MSNADKLARLHEFLKDPVRQEILLKIGEHDKLSFDELMRELKIDDRRELYDELKNLENLVTKVKDDVYSLPKKGVSEMPGEQYMLTEEGHDVLDEIIAYPELRSDNYRNGFDNKGDPKPMWGTTNKPVIVFLAIIIVATIIVFLLVHYFHLTDLRGFSH